MINGHTIELRDIPNEIKLVTNIPSEIKIDFPELKFPEIKLDSVAQPHDAEPAAPECVSSPKPTVCQEAPRLDLI